MHSDNVFGSAPSPVAPPTLFFPWTRSVTDRWDSKKNWTGYCALSRFHCHSDVSPRAPRLAGSSGQVASTAWLLQMRWHGCTQRCPPLWLATSAADALVTRLLPGLCGVVLLRHSATSGFLICVCLGPDHPQSSAHWHATCGGAAWLHGRCARRWRCCWVVRAAEHSCISNHCTGCAQTFGDNPRNSRHC